MTGESTRVNKRHWWDCLCSGRKRFDNSFGWNRVSMKGKCNEGFLRSFFLGIVMFEKFFDNRHHTSVTFESQDCICAIGVDFVNDIRSFPFRFRLAFVLVRIIGHCTERTKFPFLKALLSNFFIKRSSHAGLVEFNALSGYASFHQDFQVLEASIHHFFLQWTFLLLLLWVMAVEFLRVSPLHTHIPKSMELT